MRYLGNSEADREEIQVPDTEAQSGDIQKLESQNRMIFWAFLIVVLYTCTQRLFFCFFFFIDLSSLLFGDKKSTYRFQL